MRIALITPGFSANERDWCIPALLDLVRELALRHEVTVFTLRYPHMQGTYDVYGARVHAFGGAETTGAGRIRLIQRATRRVLREHRETPFDVVHGFWADEPGFISAAIGWLTGVPTVVSVMGGELVHLPDIGYGGRTSRLSRLLIHLALRGASRVTVGSDYLEAIARVRGSLDRIDVMPLGIDPGMFHPERDSEQDGTCLAGSPSLLSVGSLAPVKDHRTLLQAYARVIESLPDAHLHIVGDGPLRPELERLAASLGLSGRATFHGEVQHHELPDIYRAADLLVVSSRFESQCLAALEAVACGCPVIGTTVGVIPELTPEADVIPPGDSDALARGIVRVAGDTICLRRSAEHGVEQVRERFTLDQTIPNLLTLYSGLLASR